MGKSLQKEKQVCGKDNLDSPLYNVPNKQHIMITNFEFRTKYRP